MTTLMLTTITQPTKGSLNNQPIIDQKGCAKLLAYILNLILTKVETLEYMKNNNIKKGLRTY